MNYFDRRMDNFAAADQLLDIAVSFPIAFQKSNIYGAEGKLDLPHWGRLSGFVSYSYVVGSAFLPVTGGMFLGDDAADALSDKRGRILVSQDQKSHREIITQAEMLEKRTFRRSLLPLGLKPIIIPTPNQMKLMRTHHPVAILHVAAVEFVCQILER